MFIDFGEGMEERDRERDIAKRNINQLLPDQGSICSLGMRLTGMMLQRTEPSGLGTISNFYYKIVYLICMKILSNFSRIIESI